LEAREGCCGCSVGRFAETSWKIREEQMKNAFEASGNSPTPGHGLEFVKHRIEEAFAKIREHPKPPNYA
jgi:hypothetical protein